MATIPSPMFPEPITVPDNVADGDYDVSVRIVRLAALLHLLSLAAIAGLIWVWLQPGALVWLAGLEAEVMYLAAAAALVLLAALRQASPWAQAAVFGVFAVSFAGAASLYGAFLHDAFPLFTQTFAWGFVVAWAVLVCYNVLVARDYSFVGEFSIVLMCTGAMMIAVTFATELSFSEGFTIFLLVGGMAFYWTYDLAMILRRRTARQVLAAVFDLYRDALNVVGFPIRMMRMPRGRKAISRW